MTDDTQPEALRLANVCSNLTRYSMDAHLIAAELRRQHTRIADLEAQLEAVGAGGVQALSAAPKVAPGESRFNCWSTNEGDSWFGHPADAQALQSEDLSSCGAQLLEENGRKVLSYWPYCSKCRKPFEFEKDEPFASCGCAGSTEWGDPRPASWVQPPAATTQQEAQEPVAWMTFTEEGDPDMVFLDRLEACQYCEDDDPPKPLYLAAPPTTQAGGWRPIETAPKDCQAILVTEGRFCHCVEWNEEFDWWAVDDNKLGPFCLRGSSPTHWMPLPPPPTSAEGVEHG